MSTIRPTALITGASGGFGADFARLFAQDGYDLVLIARSEGKLKQLAQELVSQHGIRALVIAQDLTAAAAPQQIFDQLQTAGVHVEVLINNAGFASYGLFHELDMNKELELVQLNVKTLVHLTRLFLPGMVQRGRGRVLNVASTAAFQPGPLMANYYASKAYVLSFSEALANELEGTGVTTTCLCPGPTRTGFQDRAAMQESKLVQGGLMDSMTVARQGYAGLVAGKTIIVPGFQNWIGTFLPRFVPRKMATRLVRNLQERRGH